MLQDSEDSNNNLYSIKKNKNEIKAGRIFLSKTKARYLLGQVCFTLFQRSLLLTLLLLQVMGQGMIFQNSEVSTHWTRKQSQENQHQEKKKPQKPKPKKSIKRAMGVRGAYTHRLLTHFLPAKVWTCVFLSPSYTCGYFCTCLLLCPCLHKKPSPLSLPFPLL